MAEFKTLRSRVYVLPVDNIDTDQIIPARYLKATTKAGMGDGLFAEWRRSPDGSLNPDFPLNRPELQGAQILLAGDNFGCGSSREHAPWALTDFGLRAVISTSFADIFKNNALKNGLLPVRVELSDHEKLLALLERQPLAELQIDLQAMRIILPDGGTIDFPIDPFRQRCLLEGVDELGYLINRLDQIEAYELRREARPCAATAPQAHFKRRN